ncbi:MAG: DNA internalization-related competence protein ComEC/Rec2 [Bacillota bacterium]
MAVQRPLLIISIAFAAGIALAGLMPLPRIVFLLAAVLLMVAAALVFFVMRRDVFVVLPVIFLLLGAVMGSPEHDFSADAGKYAGRTVTLEGYICREPDFRGDKTVYCVEVDRVADGSEVSCPGGRVLLTVPGGQHGLGYGDRVRLRGRPYFPGEPGNPGQFNYRAYLSARGIWGLVSVRDGDIVERTGIGGGNPVARAALGIKQKMMEVNRATLSPEHAALVNGMIFGSRSGIDRQTAEIFNESGVVHILSVSGLHVGMLAALVLGGLRLAGMQRFNLPVLTVVLIVYSFITGMGPAVLRASVMAWVYVLSRQLGRDSDWPTTMALAALVILLFSPGALFEPGFQLSFAATWGILHLGPAMGRRLESLGLNQPWLKGMVSVSLGAQAGTIPLVAYYYNIFSLVSIPANLAAVPLVGLIMPLGILASLAGLLFIKAALVINLASSALLDLMLLIVSLIHRLPGGVAYIASPPYAVIAAWYISLAVLFMAVEPGRMEKPWLRRVMTVILCFSVVFTLAAGKLSGRGQLEVHAIDVGQGDSILVRFPGGRNMLVDAGGWKDEYEKKSGAGQVVASYLRRLGIGKIDVLVLTHPHEDHAAGAFCLLDRFDIGMILVPPGNVSSGEEVNPAYYSLLAAAAEKGIAVREVCAGDVLRLDPDVRAEVLGPPSRPASGTRSDLNNNSVVLSLGYGEKSFLLTGDIESEGQMLLMQGGFGMKHNVLKLPHHGSKYLLPEFVSSVGQDMSFISVGFNSFGQPSADSEKMAGSGGRPVYRTDRDGLLLYKCDGRTISVAAEKDSSSNQYFSGCEE